MRGLMDVMLRGTRTDGAYTERAKIYALVMMGVVTALAFMDRNILNILLTPIKQDIGASDTAMGLLTGLAFAFFYATAAIPLARMVDFGNRRNLLAISLAIWSACTALCGLAGNFWQLLLARIGVASGEASSTPAIMSIISDLYPASRRATAIGATLIGTGVGVMLSAVFGGMLAQSLGWRVALIAVGLPGIPVALLMWLTLPEPPREMIKAGSKADAESASAWRALISLFRIPSFPLIAMGKTFVQVASQASLIWFPTFLIRIHGFSLKDAGLYYGVAIALATTSAALIGGPISDRLAGRNMAWYLRFCVLSMVLSGPMAVALALTKSPHLAVLFVFLYGFTSSLNTTPSMAAALAIVRPRLRGLMSAVVSFIYNLLGAALGGLIVGFLSDRLTPQYGDQAIRYALLMMPVAIALAAICYLVGSFTIAADVRRAQGDDEDPIPVPA